MSNVKARRVGTRIFDAIRIGDCFEKHSARFARFRERFPVDGRCAGENGVLLCALVEVGLAPVRANDLVDAAPALSSSRWTARSSFICSRMEKH
ncbi:hypothetical protein [Hydrogenophaga sp.]|uniref:hypothetical protein n=1 Tax=Hydrogenophaga sp. TaxID=1904254 RepID=UPI003F6F1F62